MKRNVKQVIDLFALLALIGVFAFLFNDYVDKYNSSLTLMVTVVYVVATVMIFRANRSSVEAMNQQLVESKRQYEDKKRIEIMPYIQFEKAKDGADYNLELALDSEGNLAGSYILVTRMKNVGNGAAKGISYIYQIQNKTASYDRGAFPIQSMFSGESQTLCIEFAYSIENATTKDACFLLRYADLLENYYEQSLNIKFDFSNHNALTLTEFNTSAPVLIDKENDTVNK